MAGVPQHSLKSTVVIDTGSGYTKLGYSGNLEPSFSMKTAVMCKSDTTNKLGDMDFYLGDDSGCGPDYAQILPVQKGRVQDWNLMERAWNRAIYQYLRCDPAEHAFLLTESPLCTPEDREATAEIFFETFNAPYLYIAVQAVLSLAAASCVQSGTLPALDTISGVAVESGDGVTSIVPVAYGYTIGSAVRTIPIAGKDVTKFIFQALRDRGEKVPADMAMYTAQHVKETYGYCAMNGMVKEYKKYDKKPDTYFKNITVTHPQTGRTANLDIGYEQFLGPEMFFNPEIFHHKYTKGIPQLVDEAILSCPIDTRRAMYKNIVLSGGNTLFKKLATRLQKSIDARVQERFAANAVRLGGHVTSARVNPLEVKVQKLQGNVQKYGVWLGGSLLAEQGAFHTACMTKQQYDEEGPRIARAANGQ